FFDSSSAASAPGLTYQNAGSPATSHFATIDIHQRGAVAMLKAQLPKDLLTLGTITDAAGGVSAIDASAAVITVSGAVDTSAAPSNAGDVTLPAAVAVTLSPGSALASAGGDLTVRANQGATPASGNSIGIIVNAATILTTGTGSVLLQGRGGDAPATAGHHG